MNKNVIALAVAGALALPTAASAAQVYGDKLEVYGKIHVSLDYLDSGVSSSVANDSGGKLTDGSFSIASNSSRVGFKGKYQINDQFTALYQVEQEVNVDGSGNDNWTTRNSFVGLGGDFGKVLVGYHDTPFKSLGGEFLLFGDTAATWRAIVGACADCKSYTDANSATVAYGDDAFNNRVRNMIMYPATSMPARPASSASLSSIRRTATRPRMSRTTTTTAASAPPCTTRLSA